MVCIPLWKTGLQACMDRGQRNDPATMFRGVSLSSDRDQELINRSCKALLIRNYLYYK